MLSSSKVIATPTTIDQSTQRASRGYYIYVTEACNLRCSYCFVKDKHNDRHLTMNTAKQVLDFIARDANGMSSVYVHFFGGEPLLRPTMIDHLAGSLRAWSSEQSLQLRLGVTTNGTLLTTENCEMLKRHSIGVQLSLDGSKEGNDIHRQFMGGTQCGLRSAGAFEHVNITNYIAYFGKGVPNCRMTLTVQNLPYLSDSIHELYEIGFKSFSIIPDCDTGSWAGENIEDYERVMESVFRFWIRHDDVWVSSIDKTVKAFMTKMRRRNLCQIGTGIVGITVDGDIYPCHDFSGQYSTDAAARQQLLIGHVASGYDENRHRFSDMSIGSEVSSGCGHDCATCWAKWTCARGCPYMNYVGSGDIRIVNPTYCATQRIDALLVLKWMGSADQINLSYSTNARARCSYSRSRRIAVIGNGAATVNESSHVSQISEEAPIN